MGMKRLLILFFVFSVSICSLYSQNKTIKGRVISDFFEPMSGVTIMIKDTVEVGKTDLNGSFLIDIAKYGKEPCPSQGILPGLNE